MVELAVCLPLLVTITIATIESCRALYLKQSVRITAYECARLGVVPGATTADVEDLCTVILSSRNINSYTLTCDPADLSTLRYPDLLRVTVDVPYDENMLIGSWLFANKRLTQSVTIMAEY